MIVWLYMYFRRTAFLVSAKTNLRKVDTPEKAANVIPANVTLAAHNFRNLTELPVIFYALSIYLFVTASVDKLYVIAAWCFVTFRLLHSLIHCTTNVVIHRFAMYILASIALWFMVLRAALDLFATF